MSNLIPREKQSAWQRWEIASFNDDEDTDANTIPDPEQGQRQQQLKEAFENACAEGFEAGKTKGYAAGLIEGHEAGVIQGREEAAQERRVLLQIAESFRNEAKEASELIAIDALALALDIAKAMLKTALVIKPELVVPIVREVTHYLPAPQQPAYLHLHPKDMHIVTQHLGDELTLSGWQLVEDAHIAPGGCRADTATNQIDATTANRWQRLAAALGKDDNWLEQEQCLI